MKSRGVPVPTKDIDGIFATVEALRESVESDAQNLRTRTLPSTDRDAAVAEMNAQNAARSASNSVNSTLTSIEQRLSSLESSYTALEARVTALEAFHP